MGDLKYNYNASVVGAGKGAGAFAGRAASYLVFILWTVVTLFPLIWLGYSSFKTNTEIITDVFALPASLDPVNYVQAWTLGNLGGLFVNSAIYSTVSTFLIVMFAMMAGYAIAKMPFKRFSALVYAALGVGLLISLQSILIPLFLLLSNIGLRDSHIGVIVAYVALGLPIGVYLGTEFIKGIPDSLIESAHIDGASNWKMFTRIVLPMTAPVIVTISIINVLGVWNEFLLVFVLTSSDFTRSLPVGVYSFSSQTSTQYGWQMAALVIALLPVVLVYTIFNKKITEGVVAGAIKE